MTSGGGGEVIVAEAVAARNVAALHMAVAT